MTTIASPPCEFIAFCLAVAEVSPVVTAWVEYVGGRAR
ncbi:unnamed protein product [Ectocarpus sp. CCAP 1310/34]|nr:unnamed protein product [Ectocarpus sp. CCAP 1310/34]